MPSLIIVGRIRVTDFREGNLFAPSPHPQSSPEKVHHEGLSSNTLAFNNPSKQAKFVKKFQALFSTQNDKILRILEDLQNELRVNDNLVISEELRIRGYFCSDTIFCLSNSVLSNGKIKVSEKGLDLAPIQRNANRPEANLKAKL